MYLVIENYGMLGFVTIGKCNTIDDARNLKAKHNGSVIVTENNIWNEIK